MTKTGLSVTLLNAMFAYNPVDAAMKFSAGSMVSKN